MEALEIEEVIRARNAIGLPDPDEEEAPDYVIEYPQYMTNVDEWKFKEIIKDEKEHIRKKEKEDTGFFNKRILSSMFVLSLAMIIVTRNISMIGIKIKITSFAAAALYIFLMDPLDAWCDWIPVPSRVMAAISVISLIPLLYTKNWWYLVFPAVMIPLTIAVVKKMNSKWISREHWDLSPEVRMIINNNSNTLSAKEYLYHYRNKIMTLASCLGHNVDGDIVDRLLGIYFRLGFACGYQKTENGLLNIDRLQRENESLKAEKKKMSAEIKHLQNQLNGINAQYDESRTKIEGLESELRYARERGSDLQDYNRRLLQVNEEMAGIAAKEEEEQKKRNDINIAKQNGSLDTQVRELMDKHYTINEIVDMTQIQRNTVAAISKEYNKERFTKAYESGKSVEEIAEMYRTKVYRVREVLELAA